MPKLIPRETIEQAVQLANDGKSQSQIARELGLSVPTVKKHLVAAGVTPVHGRTLNIDDETRDRIASLYVAGKPVTELRRDFDLPTIYTVYSILRQRGVLRLRRHGGPNNSSPVGTEVSNEGGYIIVKLPVDWPWMKEMSGHGDGTWKAKHRVVMAEHLGRALSKSEQVHHKDGDRANNDLSNLQLRSKAHGSGASFVCNACGSYDVSAAELG